MTESPFLPNTQIQYAWDSTSLGAFKKCPRYYQLVHLEGWVPKDESIHIRFGQELHAAAEMYDHSRAQGLNHEDALFDVVRETLFRIQGWDPDPTTKAGEKKNRTTLLRTIVWFLDYYADDHAKTHILESGKPAVELSFRFELDYGPEAASSSINPNYHTRYILCGHLDKVVEFHGERFVKDIKTTSSSLTDYYFAQFEPSNQMTLYSLAAKVVLDAPIKGVIIDGVQVVKDYSKFGRSFTYRTPDQLEEWLSDLSVWLHQAERHAISGYWPQNDTACTMYGGCQFRQICSKDPAVRPRFLEADFTQLPEEERWNPLKPR